MSLGYTLSSEEHAPAALVGLASTAEAAGFDFLSVSDHFHPWLPAQGHSPFVWTVLGGIAIGTERVRVGTGVTCPILRTHPAVVAHAVGTTASMLGGRFFLGVGTGEALNEHVTGLRWPRPELRREMLEEAVTVIRALLTGETVDHRGRYYEVENARLFDLPDQPVPIVVSGFGSEAAKLAGRIGDGYWGHGSDPEPIEAYTGAGGSGPRYSQLHCCWAADRDEALEEVVRRWPNAGLPGQLAQDLPTWTHFEQATSLVTRDALASAVPCGPDITEDVVERVRERLAAGYDHVYFHQIGPDQSAFFRWWSRELRPALAAAGVD